MKISKSNKKGFTLVEVILGIGMLGLISICVIPMFSYGFIQTLRSGNRSEAVYQGQQSMENNLNGVTDPVSVTSQKALGITFGPTTYTVNGKLIVADIIFDSAGNLKTTIRAFKPD